MTAQIAGEGGDESQSFLHIHVPMMRRLTRQPGYTVLMGNAAATYLETNFAGGLHPYIHMYGLGEDEDLGCIRTIHAGAGRTEKKEKKKTKKNNSLIFFFMPCLIQNAGDRRQDELSPFFFFFISPSGSWP